MSLVYGGWFSLYDLFRWLLEGWMRRRPTTGMCPPNLVGQLGGAGSARKGVARRCKWLGPNITVTRSSQYCTIADIKGIF